VDRLFLDANVLYSAAESPTSRFRVFWDMGDVELVTSVYAQEEARRNLDTNTFLSSSVTAMRREKRHRWQLPA
jgi:hypothetical protein